MTCTLVAHMTQLSVDKCAKLLAANMQRGPQLCDDRSDQTCAQVEACSHFVGIYNMHA
jgi:hypothetical protein